jgi:cell division protease FtsH
MLFTVLFTIFQFNYLQAYLLNKLKQPIYFHLKDNNGMYDYDKSKILPFINTPDDVNILQFITNDNNDIFVNNAKELEYIKNYKEYFLKEDYNNFLTNLKDNIISKIYINENNYKELISINHVHANPTDFLEYHLVKIDPYVIFNLIDKTSIENIPIYFDNLTQNNILSFENVINSVIMFSSYAIPFYFIFSIIMNLFRGNKINSVGYLNSIRNIFQPKKDLYVKPNISFDSWAGSPEVIEECKEVVSSIESRTKYAEIGAELPKGILLEGPPGTGKTLLAKAIATETNSSFISISASEFVELYVGMGAARVRELFNNARHSSPCIIFIDEIDAVGKQRSTSINLSNDEREQTLNQLLYEMDGFHNNEGIIVIAATNRKDILDQALLRPGRFDRIIRIPLPDKSSREKILDFYIKQKKVEKEVSISAIAELSNGFSGAQLKNLINEAAIITVRKNDTVIKQEYIFDAFEKLLVGLIKTTDTNEPAVKERIAIHESGHTLLALIFNKEFDFYKASIQSTYNGAGGYTIFSEKPEFKANALYTKDLLKKRLIIGMGGKAAEYIYYSKEFVSVGSYEDLKQANKLAKQMISNFGMGDDLEVFFDEKLNSFSSVNKYSDNTKYIIDKETLALVNEAYMEAKQIIIKNKSKFIKLSELLQTKKVIYKKDVDDMF